MKKSFLPILVAALLLTSCVQTVPVVREKQIRMAEAQANVFSEPLILEIESYTENIVKDSIIFDISMYTSGDQVANLLPSFKQSALESFCFGKSYDMILNPTYHVYSRKQGAELVVVVKGYGVRYKKLRKATQEDSWMIK